MERKDYLDVAKLLSVLCVIHNHAGILHMPIKQTIAAFHMPIFFIIYGMVSSGKRLQGEEWLKFFEKRVRALLVPYILWALIYLKNYPGDVWKHLLFGTNQSLGRAGTNQVLWFLPCMFAAAVLFRLWENVFVGRFNKWILLAIRVGTISLCAVASVYLHKAKGEMFFSLDIALTACVFMILGNISFFKEAMEYIRERWHVLVKLIVGVAGILLTYLITTWNSPFFEGSGWQHVVMALGLYGNYIWFILGAVVGSFSLLLIAMVLEKVPLLATGGRFSLVFMAVHYILYGYVQPWCRKIPDLPYGNIVYPIAVALLCGLLCIPICFVIDKAFPALNGKYKR